MRFGVILNLDVDSADQVRQIQGALTGSKDDDPFDIYDIIYGVEPHISFALYDEVERSKIVCAIDKTFKNIKPIPFECPSIALFPGNVLYLAPRVTVDLLEIHKIYHQCTKTLSDSCNYHYLPDAWVPHCTLGVPLPAEESNRAMMRIGYNWTPVEGHLVSAELISFPPAKSLYIHPFK